MIIDAHSHGLHGKYLTKLADMGGIWAKELIADEQRFAKERPQNSDALKRVEWLNKFGIDYQVVTPSSLFNFNLFPGDSYTRLAMAKLINDSMAEFMEESKGKLFSIGTVPLVDFEPGGSREMQRATKELGLKGINVFSNMNGKPLDLPEFEPFWAQAAETDTVVYIHPEHPVSKADCCRYRTDYGLDRLFGWPFETAIALARLVFSGIIKRYPNLKIVSHHLGGGMVPFFWGRITETYEMRGKKMGNMIGEDSLFKYFSQFYYDTAVGGNAASIRCTYDVFGVNQIVFATDAPHGPKGGDARLATYPDVVRALGLSKDENEKILAGNIRRILKLS